MEINFYSQRYGYEDMKFSRITEMFVQAIADGKIDKYSEYYIKDVEYDEPYIVINDSEHVVGEEAIVNWVKNLYV